MEVATSEPGSANEGSEYLELNTKKATEETRAPPVPGRIGKVNYVLNDSVVRLPLLDKVKAAKKATLESKPDILGLRGPVWKDSVELSPGKHHYKYSGAVLSNTLSPNLVNPKDIRKLTGTTACKADKDAATLDRSRSPSHQTGGWNISTVVPNSLEKQRQLETVTTTALIATRRKSPPPTYMDPISRQTAYSETIRAIKANSGADMKELYAQYGPEGGEAMAAILQMPPKETKPRIRTRKEDLEAVLALDEFAAARELEEDPGEAVPLGPRSGDMR